jgi:hypothetical protein
MMCCASQGYFRPSSIGYLLSVKDIERRRKPEVPIKQLVEERQRDGYGARPSQSGFPRWPAAVALLAVGALYGVLSDGRTLGAAPQS